MSTTELQVLLQQRAREQAVREREERLQALRAKGIIIQTAEEREQELADLEDLVAKARREAEEIMKKEKAAAKGEQNGNGQSSSDEDWDGSESDFSGSGSDKVSGNDENSEDEMSVDEDEKSAPVHPMFDEEASENEEGESRLSNEVDIYDRERMEEDDDEELNLPANHVSRRKQNTRVLSDDEGETDANQSQPTPNTKSPVQLHSESPMPPNSVLRSASKTFIPGLTVAGPAGLGLTQIFAGTMDESQNDPFDGSPSIKRSTAQVADTEKNSMAFLQKLRAPDLPPFNPTMEDDSQDVVMDSQTAINQDPESQPPESDSQNIQLQFSQSQIQGFDSLVQDPMATQSFETLGSTQDAGFQQMTPIKGRFVEPPSTIDTVLIEPTPSHRNMAESEVSKKRGKLRRRTRVASISDEESVYAATSKEDENVESEITASIFDVMRKAAKKTVVNDDFNKKTSKAREIIDEQAEESEDEYAGLGGASEDESGSEDEYVKEMIDDDAGKEADEHQLAAFYADRERANDEKQIEKLYNDITKGMLRRKRGADYDLSDSDDDGEARRRMKRKEFARMRKALLADERIGKIAEDPKKQAFLRAIEDRPSDDEMDFLDDFVEQDDKDSESQSQGTDSEQHTESRMATLQKRKHQDGLRESGVRPPPHLRRTNPSKRPSNLAEIRQSLSSIIEEPNATTVTTEVDSDSEDDLEVEGDDKETEGLSKEKENRGPLAIRRANKPIIDRISLKRASSNASSSSGRLAFAAPSVSSGFKVPALLRRATTNSSIASVSSTSSGVSTGMSSTERTAGGASNDNIKRGGGKKSGVNFFVRESERRAALVKTEKRREQKIFKGAEVRRKAVGGILGSGKFE
ncbi:MRC1-like domain-containing protein [Xylogone sp. PMI_703]|nr:MRC1-like domain-containing protein [Xylogone sp. PMI_703]